MSRYAPTFQLLLLRNHCFQDNANNPLATSTVGKHFILFHQGCSCRGWRNCTPSLSQMSEIVEHRSCANLVSKMFSCSSCSLEVILQLGCPLAPNTTTGLSSVHVGQWVEHPPVLWGAAGGRGAQAAGLSFGSNQAAARDVPSVTGGAAVWNSFDSHLLSAVHLWQPDCKWTRVESTKCRQSLSQILSRIQLLST